MKLKTMDPNDIRKLLEGHEDILTPLMAKEEAQYKNLVCPNCHGHSCRKKVEDIRTIDNDHGQSIVLPFSPDYPLPHTIAVCIDCDCEFSPDTGIIRK